MWLFGLHNNQCRYLLIECSVGLTLLALTLLALTLLALTLLALTLELEALTCNGEAGLVILRVQLDVIPPLCT